MYSPNQLVMLPCRKDNIVYQAGGPVSSLKPLFPPAWPWTRKTEPSKSVKGLDNLTVWMAQKCTFYHNWFFVISSFEYFFSIPSS